jgi:endonuclease
VAMYEKPVRVLMPEMLKALLTHSGQIVTKDQVLSWFFEKYPKLKPGTITAHLIRFSTNAPSRLHYNARPGEEDLLFQIDGSHFRLYDPSNDPPPIHEAAQISPDARARLTEDDEPENGKEFAYESDLRDFLARNLTIVKRDLRLYSDEGITGVEFPAGGRFIDILAVTPENNYVVIELKVSRGHDRVVGQLLRYIGWIAKNHAEPGQSVTGVIVAREITEDLLLACSGLGNVELFEYQLSVTLKRVS